MLKRLFGTRSSARTIDHPLFGRIQHIPALGWENDRFRLWSYTGVLLMIDAPAAGPTGIQEDAFRRFLERRYDVHPRVMTAIAEKRQETTGLAGNPRARAISVPSLGSSGPVRTGTLWTIWFDYEAEDHWTYGVQTDDDWVSVCGFAED